MGLYMLGLSLLIVGAALIARVLRLPERIAFTAAGVLLLGLWLLPFSLAPGGMTEGIDLFFISGVMIVLAGVWIVTHNSDLLLGAIVAMFGWIRGMPPVLRAAVSYPMQSRFRTGMTLAMFSLVVFTIVTMSFITAAFGSIFSDTDRLSGGFAVRADARHAVPIEDMNEALKDAEGVNEDDIAAVGTFTGLPVEAKQRGTDRKADTLFVQGVDSGPPANAGAGGKRARHRGRRDLSRAPRRGQTEGHRPKGRHPLRAGRGLGLHRERRLRLQVHRRGVRHGRRGVDGAQGGAQHGGHLGPARAHQGELRLRRWAAVHRALWLLRGRRDPAGRPVHTGRGFRVGPHAGPARCGRAGGLGVLRAERDGVRGHGRRPRGLAGAGPELPVQAGRRRRGGSGCEGAREGVRGERAAGRGRGAGDPGRLRLPGALQQPAHGLHGPGAPRRHRGLGRYRAPPRRRPA